MPCISHGHMEQLNRLWAIPLIRSYYRTPKIQCHQQSGKSNWKRLYLFTYAGMHLKILHVSTKLTPSLSVPVFVKDVIDQYHKPPKWDVVIHIFSVFNWFLWRTRRTILGEIYSYSPSHITHESCIQGTRFEWFPFLVYSDFIYVWS